MAQKEVAKPDPNKLVIDCNIWLRGRERHGSMLLRTSDGKMCCLGIDLEAQGVSKAILANIPTPDGLKDYIPNQRSWMLMSGGLDSSEAEYLMDTNDREDVIDTERKKKITELYAEQGVEVTFINE